MTTEMKTVTRVSFNAQGMSVDRMFEVAGKIEAMLDAEGLESYYGETNFIGFVTREIGYLGHTLQEEKIEEMLKSEGVTGVEISICDEEFEVYEEN